MTGRKNGWTKRNVGRDGWEGSVIVKGVKGKRAVCISRRRGGGCWIGCEEMMTSV